MADLLLPDGSDWNKEAIRLYCPQEEERIILIKPEKLSYGQANLARKRIRGVHDQIRLSHCDKGQTPDSNYAARKLRLVWENMEDELITKSESVSVKNFPRSSASGRVSSYPKHTLCIGM